MFEASLEQFVKSMGDNGVLLPSPSLDEAEDCRPMHVVVKKRRRWCWRKPVYSPKPFLLDDLFVANAPLDVKTTDRDYVTYNMTSTFSVNGDVGAALKDVVDLKMSASDTIHVEAKLGDVHKIEVDENSLLKSLEGRILHFNHSLVKEVLRHPRKVLCVVMGTVVNSAESKLLLHATVNGKTVFNISNKAQKVVTGDITAGVSNDEDKSFVIPKNTPLAYNVYELLVSPGGHMSLVTEKDSAGGFIDFDYVDGSHDQIDGNMKEFSPLHLLSMFAGILDMTEDKRVEFRECIVNVCRSPHQRRPLLAMIKSTHEKGGRFEVSPHDMKEFSSQLSDHTGKKLLQTLGFQFKDEGNMVYNDDKNELLESVYNLMEVLNELNEEALQGLLLIKDKSAPIVFSLLKKSLKDNTVVLKRDDMADIEDRGSVRSFLKTLGFQDHEDSLKSPREKYDIYAAYCVVFALWLNAENVN